MIEVWKMEMIRKKTPDGKRYSARTINHAKSTLSRYLSYAEQLDLIKYNPCRKVPDYINQSEIIKRNEDEKNFWEHEEFKKFIGCVDDPYWTLFSHSCMKQVYVKEKCLRSRGTILISKVE